MDNNLQNLPELLANGRLAKTEMDSETKTATTISAAGVKTHSLTPPDRPPDVRSPGSVPSSGSAHEGEGVTRMPERRVDNYQQRAAELAWKATDRQGLAAFEAVLRERPVQQWDRPLFALAMAAHARNLPETRGKATQMLATFKLLCYELHEDDLGRLGKVPTKLSSLTTGLMTVRGLGSPEEQEKMDAMLLELRTAPRASSRP